MKNFFQKIPALPVLALAALIPLSATAQSLFVVDVSGTSFSPDNITINKGDTIRWINTQGSHNVNGTLATFPTNPEPFGNSIGAGWTYVHKFLNPGEYDYRCDVHFSMGMVGHITVTNINATDDRAAEEKWIRAVFPTPASDQVIIELSKELSAGWTLGVYDLRGVEMANVQNLQGLQIGLDTGRWSKGLYFFQLKNEGQVLETGTIVVQ